MKVNNRAERCRTVEGRFLADSEGLSYLPNGSESSDQNS